MHRTRARQLVLPALLPLALTAGLPSASGAGETNRIELDESDGYTFSGVQRSMQTGAIEFFHEELIGPFTITGHSDLYVLSTQRAEADGFVDCDPSQGVHSVSETITDRVVVHYTADLAGSTGSLSGASFVLPSYQESPTGTTTSFPIGALDVRMTARSGTGTADADASPEPPPPGAQASFVASFPVPLPIAGVVQVDVSIAGQVATPVGPPRTAPLGCPPPNEGLIELQTFGLSQFIAESPYLALSVSGGSPPGPTHTVVLEVERMFRQGLPVARDAGAGDTQVVVRPTTARELGESLGTMVIGGRVVPFDARASLLGEVAGSERTIASVDPDPALVRQEILDDVEASGRDSTDPREVARFLRRNPDRGLVTLGLDAGLARDLRTGDAAYVGSADAGLLDYRTDLLLREAERERLVERRGEERRVQVQLDFVESDDVTNVLPYDDVMSGREANRLRRSPQRGGIFQGAGEPGVAQLVVAADGRGKESRTNTRDFAVLYAERLGGDGSEQAAHALAHLLGHVLYGPRHDGSDPSALTFPTGRRAPEPDFFADNFDDFSYTDRTVRRGLGHLDRYWRR